MQTSGRADLPPSGGRGEGTLDRLFSAHFSTPSRRDYRDFERAQGRPNDSAAWIQAVDLDALTARAHDDEPNHFVALFHDLDGRLGGTGMAVRRARCRPGSRSARRNGGAQGSERRNRKDFFPLEERVHEEGGAVGGGGGGTGSEKSFLVSRVLADSARLSVIRWFNSDSGSSPARGRVSAKPVIRSIALGSTA